MIISVRIKLILNIFNYKVIFQCFHYFLFEKQIWLKKFFQLWNNWVHHYLAKYYTDQTKKIEVGFCQKQKFQYVDFIFISQLLNDMKYVFTGTLKKQWLLHSLC